MEIPRRLGAPVPLVEFVQKFQAAHLGVLATGTAWNDICETAGLKQLSECARARTNFGDAKAFLESLRRLQAVPHVGGIVIARGGKERLDAIGDSAEVVSALIQCGLPFYVAMGHAEDTLLLDKHADECFSLPGDFGHKLKSAVRAFEDRQSQEAELDQLRTIRAEALGELKVRDAELERLRATHAQLQGQLARVCSAQPSAGAHVVQAPPPTSTRFSWWQWLLLALASAIVLAWIVAQLA